MPSIHPVLILRFGLGNGSLTDIAVGGHIFQLFFQCSENFIALFFRENVGGVQSIGMIHQGVGEGLFHLFLSTFLIFLGKHFHIKGKGGVLYAVISLGIKVYKHRFRLFLGNPPLVGKLYPLNPQFFHKKCGQNLLSLYSGVNTILTPNHAYPFPSFFPSFLTVKNRGYKKSDISKLICSIVDLYCMTNVSDFCSPFLLCLKKFP